MNNLLVSLHLALSMLIKNKARAFLTIFGIMVGIAMVIIVLSAGAGVKGIILHEISSFGNNWIDIEVKVPSAGANSQENAQGIAEGVSITTLTEDDAKAIEKLANIKDIYAGMTGQGVITHGSNTMRPMIFGVTPSYIDVNKSTVVEGRFFGEDEADRDAQVIVLGHDVRQNLFGDSDAVGESITLDKKNFQVIGVMEELGNSGFMSMDKMVYIPLSTVQKKILGVQHVNWIIAEMKDNTKGTATAEEITALMRERHRIENPDKDDFAVTTMNDAVKIVDTIVFGITWLLISLAAISLLVGGVGIMNVMYVSVAERTFEIGLRKAVGATSGQILLQFLVEAVIVTLLGGIIGIAVGTGISFLIATVANILGFHWTFSISLFSILLGTFFSMGVGILFGIYPAKRAASLHPIVAIREE